MDKLQIIDSTTITLFSNLIFKGVGRHPKSSNITAICRQRWEIELLFKQIKQHFPLEYFYGKSANAIKIQIQVPWIANLLLMVMQRRLERKWSFSGLATMVRMALMYDVDFYTLFNKSRERLGEHSCF